MKQRYSYFIEIGNGKHKGVSAKEFKELSHHWEAGEEKKRHSDLYGRRYRVRKKM